MPIAFNCPQCGQTLKAPESFAHRRAKCNHCGAAVTVPAPSSQPSASAEPEREEPPLKFQRRNVDESSDVDLTPMIDVVFQLLIFFMVTAAFGLQKSLDLPNPSATPSASAARTIEDLEQDDDYVIVRVEADSSIWVNDSEALTEPDLFAKLRAARQAATADRRGPNKLLVVAHGDARHERVVQAVDAGSHVGMEEVRLATVEGNR